jgi:D-alanyl-D-alanine carboxypeptidase
MDARTGEVLHATNADTRLHPASLTKMLTLYIAFEAIRKGEVSLDTEIRVSRNASQEPPSKLGLREGQKIKLRYLIRAAAIKSANDAATAIGDYLGGSEPAFAARMDRTAKALGMTSSTFKNANGLTRDGHLSTARDMATLGRHLLFDYPEYYNLFGRKQTSIPGHTLYNTNRKFLSAYKGADGIKTGYTNAAGFNLVASAVRGDKRIIAAVFGGRSTAWRNQRMAELLDMGFDRAPRNAPRQAPAAPNYAPQDPLLMAGKTVNRVISVTKSLRPKARPGQPEPVLVAQAATPTQELISQGDQDPDEGEVVLAAADTDQIAQQIAELVASKSYDPVPAPEAIEVAAAVVEQPKYARLNPMARPKDLLKQFTPAVPATTPVAPAPAIVAEAKPAVAKAPAAKAAPVVVTRMSASAEALWGVNIGRYNTKGIAERILLTTALSEIETLEGAERKVLQKPTGWEANFVGLTRDAADRTCQRLTARNMTCFMVGPGT